jgi:hypothetical protein
MNAKSREHVEALEPSFQAILGMGPVRISALPADAPNRGIYLFSEDRQHVYAGRSNRIRQRLQAHRPSSGHNAATFAFRIARRACG